MVQTQLAMQMALSEAKDFVSEMPLHENFFIRGVFNAVLPQFLNPFDDSITEESISGELLEMLRVLAEEVAPDLEDGQAVPINYDMMNKKYNLDNIFKKKEFSVDSFEEQVKMSLGSFMLYKEDGRLRISDIYDFPEIGEWEQYNDVQTFDDYKKAIADHPDKRKYFYARFIGERMMNEGRDDNLKVNITLPQVAAKEPESDFEPPIPEDAESVVYRGPMTKKRWNIFSGLISPAGASELNPAASMQMLGSSPISSMSDKVLQPSQPLSTDTDDAKKSLASMQYLGQSK